VLERIKEAASAWADGELGEDMVQKLQFLATRQNEYGYDPFGFNRDDARVAAAVAHVLYRKYFRVETFGIENVPDGPCLLVANHSGQLPWDGVSIASSLLFDRSPPRLVRAMVERFVQKLPFVSYFLARCGQILGTPENCRRLLDAGEAILVFPEGVRGISKPITRRYQLEPFGAGFMRLALETRAPVVPVAIVGAEEQLPSFNLTPVARVLGLPSFPLMPTPPFVPVWPYPVRHRIHFGEARSFVGDPDDDDEQMAPLVKRVQGTIQSMLQVGLKERKHIFW
jgi:1-acyl-sn-glycerol-3-phosphate acyltransferase